MYNNQRGVITNEKNCRAVTLIEVNSKAYNSDINYQNRINQSLINSLKKKQ